MYSIHYGLYPLHNHTSPALKRVPFTFLQPPLQPLRSSPLLRGPTAAFQAPKFASHWSRSKCQGGGLELGLGLAYGKKKPLDWLKGKWTSARNHRFPY